MDVRRLSEKSGWSSWLGCLCRDIILFISIFNMTAWSTQEFTVPVALWSLWWIPGSPQGLSLMNVKSCLLNGAVSSCGNCIWNHMDFWEFLPWWWLFLGSEVTWALSCFLSFRWAHPWCACEGHLQHSETGLLFSTVSATFVLACL